MALREIFVVNGDPLVVQATDFLPVPGTAGAFVGAQIDISVATIPSGSSNFISNSTELFSLGIINGTATGGLFVPLFIFFFKTCDC